jgi:hypothetical protein
MYREWSAVWQEQPIVVKVWWHNDLFFRLKEELWIGDLLVDRNHSRGSGLFIRERLAAPVSIADCIHQLEVSIFTIDKTYCNISIDGELIGGDIDFKIPHTDLDRWPDTRRRGVLHFLFDYTRSTILKLVLTGSALIIFLFSIAMFFFFTRNIAITWELVRFQLWEISIGIAPAWLFLGLASGLSIWYRWEKVYAQTLAHQRKLDLPPIQLDWNKHEVY